MLPLCRLIYMPMSMPMSNLYGRRFVGQITSLIQSLRQEIYVEHYHEINWQKTRNMCAKVGLRMEISNFKKLILMKCIQVFIW